MPLVEVQGFSPAEKSEIQGASAPGLFLMIQTYMFYESAARGANDPQAAVPSSAMMEKRSMTIAAGIVCSDGVMIAADTEHTGEIKFNRGKIRRNTSEAFGDYAMTGTGNSAYLAMAADLIEEGLYANREQFEGLDSIERIYLFKEIVRAKRRS